MDRSSAPQARTYGKVTFRVDLADGADQLAYILHRGDTKGPGPDQFLDFALDGHEVWQLRGPIRRALRGPGARP